MNVKAATIALGLLLLGGSVAAQENPNNFHSRHNADSIYNVERPHQAPIQQPPKPTGYWEKTWGAIAPSGKDAVLGAALGASSKTEAERRALADCKAKGGGGCKVQIAYRNQCGVMTIGDNRLFTASAGTVEDAEAYGIELCESSDTNCRVYYSACTEPKFYRY